MSKAGHRLGLLLPALLGSACTAPAQVAPGNPRSNPMVDAVYVLAADSMEGRAVGTEGGARARRFLVTQLQAIGLAPLGAAFEQRFDFSPRPGQTVQGTNLLALVPGSTEPSRYLVVSAHYDHVGIRNGAVYNGADDNASGTAAVLELARRLKSAPPRHSIILAFWDGEEEGLRGANAFVANLPVPRDAIVMNLNMDMVSRSPEGVLWASGAARYPQFLPLLEAVTPAAGVTLKLGHDTPADGAANDWTSQSDQGAFHRIGIPFLYFGVEDHPGYHHPSDDPEAITPAFYIGAVETIWRVLVAVDRL